MKYIIDIPKEVKQEFDKTESIALKGAYFDLDGIIGKAIQNGIPLDSVVEEYVERGAITENMRMLKKIEDIKAEIIHYNDKHCNSEFISVGTVFEIIDKHISGEIK